MFNKRTLKAGARTVRKPPFSSGFNQKGAVRGVNLIENFDALFDRLEKELVIAAYRLFLIYLPANGYF